MYNDPNQPPQQPPYGQPQPPAGMPVWGTGRLAPGQMLNKRYKVMTLLGQGGMGAVYKAEDTQFGNRLVAVKEMSQSGLSQQDAIQAANAFKEEALMLARLKHPNLPSIYDHFTADGRWYLVMDFIEGTTLQKCIDNVKGHVLPIDEVLDIGIQLCKVLSYLHTRSKPIIFRDLKPLNIMLTPEGNVYLIDFGIARLFKPGQTKDTSIFVSPGYAPPEQYGNEQTTLRSDIYSMGATLHHLLSGNHPANSPPFTFRPLQLYDPSIPLALATLVTQMVDTDPSLRPTSMAVVRQELERIETQLKQPAPKLPPPPGPLPPYWPPQQPPYGPPQQPYGQPQYGVPPVPGYVPQQPPQKRRTGLWIFLGILVVLVLACIGGALYYVGTYGGTHNPATDVANKYYTAIQNQDYATAYSYLDASSITFNNQNLTQSLYTQAAQAVDAQKGKVTSYSITSSNTSNGANTASFTVSVTRNGSPYDVHLKLQQEGSAWKIVSVDNV